MIPIVVEKENPEPDLDPDIRNQSNSNHINHQDFALHPPVITQHASDRSSRTISSSNGALKVEQVRESLHPVPTTTTNGSEIDIATANNARFSPPTDLRFDDIDPVARRNVRRLIGLGANQAPVPPPSAQPKLYEPGWLESLKNTLRSAPYLFAIPILLPISWALHFSHSSPVAIFCVSLITVVPLAGGLGFATEELALRVGEAWGGLLNATFGNAVELLIAILALVKGEIDLVQASMIGSILSNILLVLGMSYFAGGLRFHEQLYAMSGAQMHISLLGISLLAIVLPAAYHYAYPSTQAVVSQTLRNGVPVPYGEELDNLLAMSRGLSFMLLAVYAMFLCFQLWTHAYLFRLPRTRQQHPLPGGPLPNHTSVFPRPNWVPSMADSDSSVASSVHTSNNSPFRRFRRWSRNHSTSTVDDQDRASVLERQETNIETVDNEKARTIPAVPSHDQPHPEHPGGPHDIEGGHLPVDDDEITPEIHAHDQPKIKFLFAIGMLCTMTALAGVTAEWLIESIDGLTATGNVSREFVGLILLPVIGNSVEHITAVTVSVKDKLNLSMSIAVGSSIQISLCILPILVLIGWAIGQPMMLFFDTFETITLVIAVLLVNFAISDGRTNYLEGFVMMMAYVAIALVCWFYDPLN